VEITAAIFRVEEQAGEAENNKTLLDSLLFQLTLQS
jgi:hypothetical protein